MKASNNLPVALRLAAAGISIFPADPATKKPLVKFSSATNLERGVAYFWSRYGDDALPALHLADCSLVAIDLDRGHGNGVDGVASFDALLDRHGELPPVPCVRTPRGGVHLYFRQPRGRDPLGNTASRIGPAIDSRGWHGYLIGPGAVMADGQFYEPIAGTPDLCEAFKTKTIPEMPAWLIELVDRPQEITVRGPISSECDDARGRKWALSALEGEAADLAATGSGTRNSRLNAAVHRLATMAARAWLTEREIWDAVWNACQSNGYLKDDGPTSFKATFKSAFRSGFIRPAPDPRERLSDVAHTINLKARASGAAQCR
jgi:putative DNA primase/helicase